jgi:hypothetical protein
MGYSMFVSGLTHHDARHAFPGYTLFSAMSGEAMYLVSMQGELVHRWQPPAGAKFFYGQLLPNGNLLTNITNGMEIGEPAGPRTALVAELGWQGDVAWSFADPVLHHAHCRLANGNTMVLATDILGPDDTQRLYGEGGPRGEFAVWSESLWEITPKGGVAWRWHAREHLNPKAYPLPQVEVPGARTGGPAHREWLHLNAIEELPDGDLLLSFNTLSAVIVVSRATGTVMWRQAPETSSQHNPTWLETGKILVFDNGSRRNFSRVIEIDRASNQVTWEYTGSPRDAFFSMNVSGAQRLANGNTLITEGRSGRLFEVTPEGEIVWEYINPHEVTHRGQRSRAVFRSYRYAPDSPEIAGRI